MTDGRGSSLLRSVHGFHVCERTRHPGPISAHPLHWRETSLLAPGPGQLLLEVVACGVCRSNLHMIEGDWAADGVPAINPIIPGHEVTGRVAALGEGVTGFALGDPVGVQPLWWTCEECEYCTSGREYLCHQRVITGEHVHGGYGQYMVATAAHTYPIPAGLDLIDAAPLFCPGITAFGVVDKLDVGPGDTVAVFGLGGVGHMAVQFALLTGADVVAVGRTKEHLVVARELGATRTVDSTDPAALEQIADSADAVLTFADSDAVTAQALRTLKWGGTLVTAVPLNLPSFPFNQGQVIKASILGNREQMRTVLQLAAEGKVRTVTERFAMSEAATALELLAQGKLRSRAVLHN
ncbi:alcohol dehydrogenase catalytic domain-containing protein [Raineyella fluvialis]|uniref:alcohol dehydrogenase n=1 Tax=Raineyella fluvialis TaxID=2662261 RepID=A0A5Q2FBG4_9ACTN|nr:alcohol dehydrogenase catalytic domain-containing protein [Raineyella fluvialis]QGF24078.1 alcohol dehydrogenase catalytic domain-containing protein [Raineyella fluvialis]